MVKIKELNNKLFLLNKVRNKLFPEVKLWTTNITIWEDDDYQIILLHDGKGRIEMLFKNNIIKVYEDGKNIQPEINEFNTVKIYKLKNRNIYKD